MNWRWCFGLSIPLCLLSHITIFFILKPELVKARCNIDSDTGEELSKRTFMQKISVIDWPGLILFLASCIAIILALTWGGATYAWHSPQVIILLVAGGVLFLGFVWVEYSMEPGRWLEKKIRVPGKQAMIPAHLFYEKDIVILAFLNFAEGASKSPALPKNPIKKLTMVALYAMFYFISVYFAIVEQYSASKAGLQLLFYLPGIGGMSSPFHFPLSQLTWQHSSGCLLGNVPLQRQPPHHLPTSPPWPPSPPNIHRNPNLRPKNPQYTLGIRHDGPQWLR